jgi:hypothetical protein
MARVEFAAGLACTIAALLSATGIVSPPSAIAATGPAALTDGVADTINRDTNDKLASPATDIVSATVDSGAGGIVLTFKTQQMGDPGTDAHWASPNTFVSWQIDSTGDGKVDDLIRFSADRATPGGITGDLTHWSGPGKPAKHCDAVAAFNAATGYVLTIDPACMGNPASITYRVQLTYDTNPGGTKPPLAFDVAPDTGLAGPVAIAVATAPAGAPPAGGAAAPTAGTPTPTPTQAGAPAPGGTSSVTKPAAKPAAPKPAAPKPATTATTRTAAGAPAPAAPAAPKPGALAATGTSSARWLGALGGALLLLGGLGLMTPADRRRQVSGS